MALIEEHPDKIIKKTDQSVKNPIMSPGIRNILVILIVLIVIGAVGYLIIHNRSKNNQSSSTADQIHNTFNAPTSTSPSFVPPQPGSAYTQGPGAPALATTTPPNISARNPAVTQEQPSSAAPAAPVVYQNQALGFALTLPGNWTVDDKQSPDHVVFFDRSTGQIAGYMEVYNNTSNNNLDTLARILQGSPAVSGINTTSVGGQPAIQYSAASGYTGGMAAISNNRVYYFHGDLTNPNILSGFKFL